MNKELEDEKVDPRIRKLEWNILKCNAQALKSLKTPKKTAPVAKAQ